MNERPITIRHLAKLLKVSDATVSMALRNHPSISTSTRERVQALAKKLGYRGNVLVSALLAQVRRGKLGSSGEVVALLVEGTLPTRSPSVIEGVAVAEQRAKLLGLRLETFLLGRHGGQSASVNRVLISRGIRGAIIAPVSVDLKPLVFDWDRFAWMTIGYSFRQHEMHRVAHAHFAGAMTCYGRMLDSGCKRIGFVLLRDDDQRSRNFWQAAARCGPHVSGGSVVPPLILDGPADRPLFERWVERHRPDGIIGNYPDVAATWMVELGMERAYASLDHIDRPWAGIRQSWAEIFSTAVDQLAAELARNEFGLPKSPKVTLIEGSWVDGRLAKATSLAKS